MKKLTLFVVLCICLAFFTACKNNDSQNPNDGQVDVTSNDGGLTTEYKKPDFTQSAGYEVVKDNSLSNVSYNGVHLIDNQKSQLDLEFSDGRKAILTVTGSEYFVDEEEATNFAVLNDTIEVSKIEGLDNTNHYYWTKEDTYYSLITESVNDFSKEDIEKLVAGFSIKAGENY